MARIRPAGGSNQVEQQTLCLERAAGLRPAAVSADVTAAVTAGVGAAVITTAALIATAGTAAAVFAPTLITAALIAAEVRSR
jgi:hypothetical protein